MLLRTRDPRLFWPGYQLYGAVTSPSPRFVTADNEVKTLEECQAWKESSSMLRIPVIGIKVYAGSGCMTCKYSSDRLRKVTAHMETEHDLTEELVPVTCSIQKVYHWTHLPRPLGATVPNYIIPSPDPLGTICTTQIWLRRLRNLRGADLRNILLVPRPFCSPQRGGNVAQFPNHVVRKNKSCRLRMHHPIQF